MPARSLDLAVVGLHPPPAGSEGPNYFLIAAASSEVPANGRAHSDVSIFIVIFKTECANAPGG